MSCGWIQFVIKSMISGVKTATYPICASNWLSGSLSSSEAFMFSLTVKIAVSMQWIQNR